MTRPIYQTEADEVEQARVITRACRAWLCGVVEMPKLSVADYLLTRNDVGVGWAEVKSRDNPSTRYKDYLIALSKWDALWELSVATKLPAVLLVAFSDDTLWTPITERPHTVRTGGRTDRGDDKDVEQCAFTPMDRFKRLRELPRAA